MGTVWTNMDHPFGQFWYEQIGEVLGQCGLQVSVEGMPSILGATVAE